MSLNEDAQTLLKRVDVLRHACDLDLLIFFVKHPRTLMASEQLATFMGYDLNQLAESLDVLLDAGLVTRSQTRGRVARMYEFTGGGIHSGSMSALLALGSTRPGRLALLGVLKTRSSVRPTHPSRVRPKPDPTPSPRRRGAP